jgi:hypothetical protein
MWDRKMAKYFGEHSFHIQPLQCSSTVVNMYNSCLINAFVTGYKISSKYVTAQYAAIICD